MPTYAQLAIRDHLIEQLGLQAHPEGGFYRETYRADDAVECIGRNGKRAASTAIYYLLCGEAFSAWHRIRSDELWHFYAGDPIDIHVLDQQGQLFKHSLGNPLENVHCAFQALVSGGDWFAAERSADVNGFSLVGCTVAPGFEFSEFELADSAMLLLHYPQASDLIQRFSKRTAG